MVTESALKKTIEVPERLLRDARELNENNRRALPRWRENWEHNWQRVADLPGIKHWFGRFKNVPAVIVNAGPSLEKALAPLRDVRAHGRAPLLISVDAAYRSLQEAEISPDITLTLDCAPHTAKFFATHQKGDLVALSPFQSPELVQKIPISDTVPYSVYSPNNPFWWEVETNYFRGNGTYFGRLIAGGTVGTAAAALAFLMGCNPIIFVGLDLSFHTPEQRRNNEPLLEMENIYGEKVLTCRTFQVSKDWYEWAFGGGWLEGDDKKLNATWINATGGGILKENCILMEPAEALEKYAGPEINHVWHLRKRLKR